MFEEPFDCYVYPEVIENPTSIEVRGPGTNVPKTFRVTREEMGTAVDKTGKNIAKKICSKIELAMNTTQYEEFAQYRADGHQVEHAHDDMHNLLGTNAYNPHTKQNGTGDMYYPEYTAFDPIFWFMHCDYDRLLFEWQRINNALTVDGLRKTFREKDKELLYLESPMHPWNKVIFKDLVSGGGVSYDKGSYSDRSVIKPQPRHFLGLTNSVVTVKPGAEIVIRNFDRTKINGSFTIYVFKESNGEKKIVGEKFFFQRMDSKLCPSCNENALMNFGFLLKESPKPGDKFSFKVEASNENIPLRQLGNLVLSVHQIIQ